MSGLRRSLFLCAKIPGCLGEELTPFFVGTVRPTPPEPSLCVHMLRRKFSPLPDTETRTSLRFCMVPCRAQYLPSYRPSLYLSLRINQRSGRPAFTHVAVRSDVDMMPRLRQGVALFVSGLAALIGPPVAGALVSVDGGGFRYAIAFAGNAPDSVLSWRESLLPAFLGSSMLIGAALFGWSRTLTSKERKAWAV